MKHVCLSIKTNLETASVQLITTQTPYLFPNISGRTRFGGKTLLTCLPRSVTRQIN